MKDVNKYLNNDYSIVFIFDVIAKLLTAVTTIMIIRLLTVTEYANYTVFLSVSSLIFSIVGSGISMAYVRYAAENVSLGYKQSNRLLNECYLFITVVTLSFFALTGLLCTWYNISLLVSFLSVIYGGLLSLNKITQSFFQAENQYKKSGIITNIKNVSFFVFVLIAYMVTRNSSSLLIIVLMVLSATIAFVISLQSISRYNSNNTKTIKFVSFKSLIKEGGLCLVYCFFVALFDQSNILILSIVGDSQDVANFGVASKYYALILMFLSSLLTVLRVKVSDNKYVEDSIERKLFINKWIKKIWWISLMICVCCIFAAEALFPLINGVQYDGAIVVFQVLMIGVFVSYTFAPSSALMLTAERYLFLCVNSFASLVIGCLICYWGVPVYGVIASGLSVVVSNAIFNVVNYFAIIKQ